MKRAARTSAQGAVSSSGIHNFQTRALTGYATKVCKRCGDRKPLQEFPRNHKMRDGRLNVCKVCFAADMRDYRRRHYRRVVAAGDAYKARNPEKARAHVAVCNALRSGRLFKPGACEGCGKRPALSRELQAHHRDYSKPLEVQWLCAGCHKELHLVHGRKGQPADRKAVGTP